MSFCYCHKFRILKLSLALLLLAPLTRSVAYAEAPENQVQLEKIKSSIDITKKRIRSTSEVTFVPDLQFLLAELLLQKARLMYIIKKESATGKLEDVDFSAEKRQVMEGVDQLRLVEVKYPSFREMDKVLLTMGLELRKVNDHEKALQSFKKLSERATNAAYKGRAFLEIGNIFFDRKDYEFALTNFQKVGELVANPSTAAAAYKAGWCEINLEHFLPAMLNFEKVFEAPAEDPATGKTTAAGAASESDEKKKDLREDALIASVWPFSELSEKETSDNPRFLQPIEYYEEKAQDKIILRRTLRRLSQRLSFKNRDLIASQVAERAFLIQADLEESLEMMENIFTLDRKAKRRDVSEPVLARIDETLWLLKERSRKKDLVKYEPHLREMLTRAHAFSVQSSKRIDDLRTLVAGYEIFLKIYPKSKSYNMLLVNQAEAAFVGQNYLRAAHLYMQVAKLRIPKLKVKEFYDSAAQAYAMSLKEIESLSLLEQAQVRTGYRGLMAAYERSFPKDKNLDAIRFNIAKNYYDEQSYALAVVAFREYLKNYPLSKNTEAAAVLMMDSFYLQDDIASLLRAGEELLKSWVDDDLKVKISQVMQEAKLKQVQSVAGEFATRKYADKFLEVAAKNKNSTIGETALFEAFNSLRAGSDEKLYQVGEEYLARFRKESHSKDILSQMIKLSLVTLELDRAANYMQLYAQDYPDDPQTVNYRTQAVMLWETTGQANKAIEAHLQNKNRLRAVQIASQYGQWDQVQKIAADLSGGTGLYYQGSAFLRQGKGSEAVNVLQRSWSETKEPAPDELLAHAGIILAENQIGDLFQYENQTFSVPLLQKILEVSKSANQILQGVLTKQSARWSVAALAVIGRLNSEMAHTISSAQPPVGMTPEAFHRVIDPKVTDYKAASVTAFARCHDLAQKEGVHSAYLPMCLSGGKTGVTESAEFKVSPLGKQPAVTMNAPIRAQLLKTPKAFETLQQALSLNEKQKNYYGAYAVSSRMTEVEPGLALGWSALGLAALEVGRDGEAVYAFREALKRDPQDKRASQGLASMGPNGSQSRIPANQGSQK